MRINVYQLPSVHPVSVWFEGREHTCEHINTREESQIVHRADRYGQDLEYTDVFEVCQDCGAFKDNYGGWDYE